MGQGTELLKFTFEEEIMSIPRVSIDQAGTSSSDSNRFLTTRLSTNTFSYVYNVQNDNGKDFKDGTAKVYLESAFDKAGNLMQTISNNEFLIVTKAPQATVTFQKLSILARDEFSTLNVDLETGGIRIKENASIILFMESEASKRVISGTGKEFGSPTIIYREEGIRAEVRFTVPSQIVFEKLGYQAAWHYIRYRYYRRLDHASGDQSL